MRIVLIGASGHGKVCAEVAKMAGYREILFLDDNKELKECAGCTVAGTSKDFEQYVNGDTEFFVSIGNAKIRKGIQERVGASGGKIATLTHPQSVVSKDSVIEDGVVIMPGVVINPGTVVEKGCIVNTSSSVDHDCKVRNYSHIAVGSHLCGAVDIGEECWIGAGATVSNNISICGGCTIGAGAVVIKDIEVPGTYVGVPARRK